MARNKVQFQRGSARPSLLFFTERRISPGGGDALALAIRLCLPGLRRAASQLREDPGALPCAACRRQTSVIAGTIFAATKVPLCIWFRAMYHLTESKGGISSIELGRRLGVTQTTAWKIEHKLMQAMMERDATKRLTGRMRSTTLSRRGAQGGMRGRGSPGKTPIVAAVKRHRRASQSA